MTARHVAIAARARGALTVDPKTLEGETFPERVHAWDEDETTLAIDAAVALLRRGREAHAPDAQHAVVGPGIDVDTFRVALGLPNVVRAEDPMAAAKAMTGPVVAVGCPPASHSAIAALVLDGAGDEPKTPEDVSASPRVVSAIRALQELRRVKPAEEMSDRPMGAYVPWGTWAEDLPARLRLVAQRCTGCARTIYPPRAACPQCRSRAFEPVQLPPRALVYTASRIGIGGAPSEFALEQAQVGEYWVGVVEWPDEGVRVMARLWGYDEQGPAIGDAVRPVVRVLFDQEGKRRYGVKFTAEA